MGIITDLLQSADKLNEDLALHDYVSFEVFFDIMLLHCDDDYSLIAEYLSDSHEFQKLNYYEYSFDEKNDSWGMIKYSHDQLKDMEADNEMVEPILYFLEDVIDNGTFRGYCSEYYFSIRELLLADAIKKLGLTKEKFEFIYSALNLEFYEVHAILIENKRLKTLLANFKKSYKADGEIDLLEYVLESQERIDQLEKELATTKKNHTGQATDILPPRTANIAAKIIAAMVYKLDLNPAMPHSAENQDLINDALDRLGVEPLGKKAIADWLKAANNVSI